GHPLRGDRVRVSAVTRTLILGGAGFIGCHLAQRLADEGHELTLVDDFSRGRDDTVLAALRARPNVACLTRDLTRPDALTGLGREWAHVYMLAAVVGVRNVEQDPARVVRVNTLALLHLLDWLPGAGEVLFFASTSETYAGGVLAGSVPVPTPEDVPLSIPDVAAPRFAYAASKLLGEAAVIHAARARGLRAVIGRFHNVYGPRMGADHVVPEFALRAWRREDPFRVYGAEQRRAFCHVADAVEAVTRLVALGRGAGGGGGGRAPGGGSGGGRAPPPGGGQRGHFVAHPGGAPRRRGGAPGGGGGGGPIAAPPTTIDERAADPQRGAAPRR